MVPLQYTTHMEGALKLHAYLALADDCVSAVMHHALIAHASQVPTHTFYKKGITATRTADGQCDDMIPRKMLVCMLRGSVHQPVIGTAGQ